MFLNERKYVKLFIDVTLMIIKLLYIYIYIFLNIMRTLLGVYISYGNRITSVYLQMDPIKMQIWFNEEVCP